MNGSCLCGAVKFKLNSELLNVVNCHCNFCRSHSGAAFSTYAVFAHSALEFTQGPERLRAFAVAGGQKHFCGECGTPIFNLNDKYPGACIVYLGTLDGASALEPKVNIWSESKLGWVDSVASIPSLPHDRRGK